MTDEAIPSISTGEVGSRFVSQSDVDAARSRREEQWKAAYARCLSFSSSTYLPEQTFFLTLGSVKNHRPHHKKTRTMVVVWQRSAPISPIILRTRVHVHPGHYITLETCRQSRKSRAMAKRHARTHSRPHHHTHPFIPPPLVVS